MPSKISAARSQIRQVLTGALVVALLTSASRFLGLFRDVSLAWFIDEKYLDLFFLAFVVPNLFRRLFGEGALTSAFVPVYTERLEAKDTEGAQRLAASVLTGNLALLGLLVLLGEAICLVVWLAVSDPDQRTLAELFAIMLPYLALICGAAVLMAVLNSHRRFAIPAAAPMLLNLALIAAVYFFARGREGQTSVRILAFAVIVGGIVQFALQWPAARAVGFRFRARLDFKDPNFRLVIQRIAPVVIGVGVFQINTLIDQLLAYGMIAEDGAVTYLQLGTRLVQLPMALAGAALATSSLPALSSYAARKDMDGFRATLGTSIRSMLFLTVPAAVGLAMLAEPIVDLAYHHGKFGGFGPARTAWVVVAGASGLVAFGLTSLLARGFHALGDTRTPVRVAAWTVLLNVGLNVALLAWDRHYRSGDASRVLPAESLLMLASTISFHVQALALSVILWRRLGEKISLGASAGMGLAAAALAIGVGLTLQRFGGDAVDHALSRLLVLVVGPDEDEPTAPVPWTIPPDAICGIMAAFLAYAGAIFLWLRLHSTDRHTRRLSASWARITAVSAPMGYLVYVLLKSLPLPCPDMAAVIQRVVAPVALGMLFYWFFASLFDLTEYREMIRILRSRKHAPASPPASSAALPQATQ